MSKRLNLLTKESPANRAADGAPAGPRINPRVAAALLAAALAVWQGPGFVRQARQLASRQHDLEELRRAKATLQTQVQAAEDQLASDRSALKLLQAETEMLRKSMTKAQRPATPISSIVADLGSLIPEQVWLTKLVFSAQSLTITGASDDASAATQLMESLEKSGKFTQTTFGYARRTPSEKESSGNKLHAFVFEISTSPVLGLEIKEGSS